VPRICPAARYAFSTSAWAFFQTRSFLKSCIPHIGDAELVSRNHLTANNSLFTRVDPPICLRVVSTKLPALKLPAPSLLVSVMGFVQFPVTFCVSVFLWRESVMKQRPKG
jgi:hypothetical protein